jgi:hypothetical protein
MKRNSRFAASHEAITFALHDTTTAVCLATRMVGAVERCAAVIAANAGIHRARLATAPIGHRGSSAAESRRRRNDDIKNLRHHAQRR